MKNVRSKIKHIFYSPMTDLISDKVSTDIMNSTAEKLSYEIFKVVWTWQENINR